jgi:putative transcriptional regulator
MPNIDSLASHDGREVMELNPSTRGGLPNISFSFSLSLIIILVLPALLYAGPALNSAAFRRKNYDHAVRAYALPAPGGEAAEKPLARGMFLVADRGLIDPNFSETVILLISYGPEGAMGLVINRPLEIKLSAVFPDAEELKQSQESLYLGGPVEPGGILLLVKSEQPPDDAIAVFDDVYLSSNEEMLRRLIKNPSKDERFRLYTGYAGWAAKQLESECNRGDWHVLQADAETLFDRRAPEIWPDLIQRISAKWVRLKLPATNESTNQFERLWE